MKNEGSALSAKTCSFSYKTLAALLYYIFIWQYTVYKLAKSICIFVLRQAVNISHTLNQTKLENWSTFFITSLRLN